MNVFQEINKLIEDKRALYFASGVASSVKGNVYFTIWGRPSNDVLAYGYGDTIEDAARDALSKVGQTVTAPRPVPATKPSLPGLTTRPALPGLTR